MGNSGRRISFQEQLARVEGYVQHGMNVTLEQPLGVAAKQRTGNTSGR